MSNERKWSYDQRTVTWPDNSHMTREHSHEQKTVKWPEKSDLSQYIVYGINLSAKQRIYQPTNQTCIYEFCNLLKN